MPNSMDTIRKKFKTKQEYDEFLEAVSLNYKVDRIRIQRWRLGHTKWIFQMEVIMKGQF